MKQHCLTFCLLLSTIFATQIGCSKQQQRNEPPVEIVETTFTKDVKYWGLDIVVKNSSRKNIESATFGVKFFSSNGEQINKSDEEFRFKSSIPVGSTESTRWTFNNTIISNGIVWLMIAKSEDGSTWKGEGPKFRFSRAEN